MATDKKKLKVFDLLPELLEIPDDDFNKLILQWLNSPVAKECGVSKISVGKTFSDTTGQPSSQTLGYSLNVTHDFDQPELEQQYPFPMDHFLNYMIDHGIQEGMRGDLRSRIPLIKQRDPEAYLNFVTSSPVPLLIRCTNRACGQILATPLSLPPGEDILWLKYDPVTCPKCGTTFPVKPTDFFTREDPTAKLFHFRIEVTGNPMEMLNLVNDLNDREFEGRPPETVMFMGFNKGERGTFGHAFFLERPVSHNKFQHPETHEWQHIAHAATGETFLPYQIADLSILSSLKLLDQPGY